MPPHPTQACYCHVIEAGLANIERHTRGSALGQIANELEHLRSVTEILTAIELYGPSDPRHDPRVNDRYWNEVRPRFLEKADSESLKQHSMGWAFLAFATRDYEFEKDPILQSDGT